MMRRKTVPLLLMAGLIVGAGGLFSPPVHLVGGEEKEAKAESMEDVKTVEELRNVPVEQIEAWPSYDSRKYDLVTDVENQTPYDLCWAFSSAAAAETSILREGCDPTVTRDTLDLDEIEIAKAVRGKFLDPLGVADGQDLDPDEKSWNQSGVIEFVERMASHWQGLYNQKNTPESAEAGYSEYILDSFEMCKNEVSEIKHLVARYGAAAFEFRMGGNTEYHVAKGTQNHACTIVGWDDSVSKEKFSGSGVQVTQDGAWIVKNSWGSAYHGDGYFYLSYDSDLVNISAFDLSPYREGTFLYNYAGNTTGTMNWYYQGRMNAKFAYVFEPQFKSETITSVCVGAAGKNPKITVDIYTGLTDDGSGLRGASSPTQTVTFNATCTDKGLYTIPLNEPITIEDGKPFCVVASVSNMGAILMDFNGNTGDTVCYVTSGSLWSKLQIGDGSLPAIHPVVNVDLSKRTQDYGDALMEKIASLDKIIASLGGKGFSAEGYEEFSQMQKELALFTDEEREKLWVMDKSKVSKYENYIERWAKLVKGAKSSIEICKELF